MTDIEPRSVNPPDADLESPMAMAVPQRIISADCHINEPPHVFDGVPAAMKDRAPKMKRGDGWSFDEILPGNYDGKAHVEDMDKDGVDVSIVYPAYAAHADIMPESKAHLTRLGANLLASDLEKISSGNAARVFGI
ncbi:MAG: hypothetical protein CL908_19505 [Deltaproteobacteria bacterium]|nr:hypothetical protein [Deltaproteobacteria bacterium]